MHPPSQLCDSTGSLHCHLFAAIKPVTPARTLTNAQLRLAQRNHRRLHTFFTTFSFRCPQPVRFLPKQFDSKICSAFCRDFFPAIRNGRATKRPVFIMGCASSTLANSVLPPSAVENKQVRWLCSRLFLCGCWLPQYASTAPLQFLFNIFDIIICL